jgi:GTP pyrophosphokinase
MDIINNEKANLYAINAKTTREKKVLINIKLKISNIEQLESVMKKIRILNGINDVYRTKN